MRDILISLLTLFISISVIGQEKQDYNLQDFYSENMALTMKTDEIHARLTEEQRVAQMLIASLGKLGKPYSCLLYTSPSPRD